MRTVLVFCIIFLTSILFLFRESFSIGFFQDDFFALSISNASSVSGVFSFFIPRTDVQFYRPLSVELWYFTGRTLFGLQPMAFHISAWATWSVMIILVYRIGKKFLRHTTVRYLFPVLYGWSAVHYNSLFWNANVSYLAVSACFFSALLVWWSEWADRRKMAVLSLIFVTGLLCHEFMIMLVPLLTVDGVLRRKVPFFRLLRSMLPLLILCGLYVTLRATYRPDTGSYPIRPSAVVSSYRWFLFFFLNWPDAIKDNMVSAWVMRRDFAEFFSRQVTLWLLTSVVIVIGVFAAYVCAFFRRTATSFFLRSMMFALCWFLLSLLPIAVIPSQITPHHGSIALAGFLLLMLLPIDATWKRVPYVWRYSGIFLVIIVWLLSSRTTVMFDNDTYWIKRRSDIAKTWEHWTKNMYPAPENASTIIIPTDEKEVRVSLDEGEAIRQWYDNPTLGVEFREPNTH